MNTELLIALGAGVGAPARYLVDQKVKKFHRSLIPLETLVINTVGSFILGVTVHSNHNIGYLIGTGFAGAFTTWSAFAVEAHHLIKEQHKVKAYLYLALTLVLGIGAAAIGNYL
jgi:fluoride exporter